MTEIEIWKDIKGYEGLYQVSNLGNIKSFSKKRNHQDEIILKPWLSHGYPTVGLFKNNIGIQRRVHRLVAENFIKKENKNHNIVNHKDGDKTNNNIKNLEWCTQKENVAHAINNHLFNPHNQNHSKTKFKRRNLKPIIQLDKNGKVLKKWACIADVERELGYKNSHITECCKGKLKSSRGYIWKYEEKERIIK